MKLNMYSIYDTAAACYTRPFYMQSDGQAMRSFTDISSDADHEIGKHPEDYSLHRIGVWDDSNARTHSEKPECLSTALEAIANSRAVNPNNLEVFDKNISAGGTA